MNIKIGNTPVIKVKYEYNGKENYIYIYIYKIRVLQYHREYKR